MYTESGAAAALPGATLNRFFACTMLNGSTAAKIVDNMRFIKQGLYLVKFRMFILTTDFVHYRLPLDFHYLLVEALIAALDGNDVYAVGPGGNFYILL